MLSCGFSYALLNWNISHNLSQTRGMSEYNLSGSATEYNTRGLISYMNVSNIPVTQVFQLCCLYSHHFSNKLWKKFTVNTQLLIYRLQLFVNRHSYLNYIVSYHQLHHPLNSLWKFPHFCNSGTTHTRFDCYFCILFLSASALLPPKHCFSVRTSPPLLF